MVPRACGWVCVAVVLALSGCAAPLDETKNVTLDFGDKVEMKYDLDGQPKEQTITVEVTAADSEVNVFIILADKISEFEGAAPEKRAQAAAASELRTKSAKISAKVPAKTDYRVLVQLAGMKKTDAKIRITNKK